MTGIKVFESEGIKENRNLITQYSMGYSKILVHVLDPINIF